MIWGALAIFTLVDAMGLWETRLRIEQSGLLTYIGSFSVLAAIVLFYQTTQRSVRIMRCAHSVLQLEVLACLILIATYVAAAARYPLRDSWFLQADSAVGFDLAVWTTWVNAHLAVHVILWAIYNALFPVTLMACMYLALSESADEFIATVFVTSIILVAIALMVPAVGRRNGAPHVGQFLALREGTLRTVLLSDSRGLIMFPSFHAALAILVPISIRKGRRWLFLAGATFAALTMVSALSEGGHYLVDVAAGAAVACASATAISWAVAPTARRRDSGSAYRRPRPTGQSTVPEYAQPFD